MNEHDDRDYACSHSHKPLCVCVLSVECVSVDVVEVHATVSTHTLYVGAVVGRFIYERCLSVIKQLCN